MEWISVKDRLPETGDTVLAWRESTFTPGVYYASTGTFGFYHEGIWGDKDEDNWNVTHWMPLPEPPEQ